MLRVDYLTGPPQLEAYFMRWCLRSKIHNAVVTEANLNYVGSITIDADLVRRAGLWVGEKVLVVSNTSGARLETYVIEGDAGSGDICMNGAAAHLIQAGEEIIIMGFELSTQPIESIKILLSDRNRIATDLSEEPNTVL